ncbi:transcriptional regulator, LacI family [Agromyces sp. CF514]|uniref:LacI family DNA-binding transcriptional regulator n=1 Tax=Agromyces sp. CF514 TaxID=1881031 RepID=UPI0008F291FD|nr:LacI family DNA-binding transcriptional regulator [Agromyces sp. CF514]SFR69328.1 transcriptional regulator, LacI family [Agromyces sp. CF514]
MQASGIERSSGEPQGPASARAAGVRDVAALAGVSRQTVSRVLNEHPQIKESTRRRVMDAIAELQYTPNFAARALGTRRSRTIGVLASDSRHYGPSTSIAALEAAARAAGHWVSTAYVDSADLGSVSAGIAHLRGQAVDGIVVVAPHVRVLEALDELRVDVPVVTLLAGGRGVRGDGGDRSPAVDQVEGARIATRHLVELGHTRIAHLAGPSDWLESSSRERGFELELAAHGLEPAAIVRGDWSARSGHDAGEALLGDSAAEPPTAVFAANDQMALGLMRYVREHGGDVPGSLSLVGFDDIPDAEYFWPPLTTVRQDFDELARRAVAALVERPERPDGADAAADRPMLVPELIVRESAARR